jgi:hypothetical protein
MQHDHVCHEAGGGGETRPTQVIFLAAIAEQHHDIEIVHDQGGRLPRPRPAQGSKASAGCTSWSHVSRILVRSQHQLILWDPEAMGAHM